MATQLEEIEGGSFQKRRSAKEIAKVNRQKHFLMQALGSSNFGRMTID